VAWRAARVSGWRGALVIVAGAIGIFAAVVGLGFLATRERPTVDAGAAAQPDVDEAPELEVVDE